MIINKNSVKMQRHIFVCLSGKDVEYLMPFIYEFFSEHRFIHNGKILSKKDLDHISDFMYNELSEGYKKIRVLVLRYSATDECYRLSVKTTIDNHNTNTNTIIKVKYLRIKDTARKVLENL